MSYKVVKIHRDDNFDICELYEKAFGQPMCEFNSSEIYLWFYFENLFEKNYSRVLTNGKVNLSYWGFIPIDCKINDRIHKGSMSFQLVSTPETLGATLLLWKEIKKDIINDDVVINYTINNENSCLLLKNLGWKVENTPILINVNHPFKLLYDFIGIKISNRIINNIIKKMLLSLDYISSKFVSLLHDKYENVITVNCFDEHYNDLLDIMNKSIIYGVNLDDKYMNWRYIDKPNNTYKILSYLDGDKIMGYIIYNIKREFGTQIGYIMDIIADPNQKNIINTLIQCAKKELYQEKVTIVSALSFKGNIFYKNLKSSGFFNVPQKLLPRKSYFSIYNFIKSENDFEVNKWHISWGNHDNA